MLGSGLLKMPSKSKKFDNKVLAPIPGTHSFNVPPEPTPKQLKEIRNLNSLQIPQP